jgi:predicted nucleic acid-binding protein
MAFVLSDEATADTDKILDTLGKGANAFTPPLWRWEVANVLLMAEKRRRITAGESGRHLVLLKGLPIEQDEHSNHESWNAALSLARKHGLTVYDAAYLELALRKCLPLGSLDAELRKAAKSEGVQLLPQKL